MNSKSFILIVPSEERYAAFRLFYDGGGNIFQKRGYYSSKGMFLKKEEGEILTFSNSLIDNSNPIELKMISGELVSGIIRLPEGMTSPPGGLYIKITYYKASASTPGKNIINYWHLSALNVKIPEGKNNISFKFILAVDDVYNKVYAFCFTANSDLLIKNSFYAKGLPVSDLKSSEWIAIRKGVETNLDMELLAK
jgi:hypothetical protein